MPEKQAGKTSRLPVILSFSLFETKLIKDFVKAYDWVLCRFKLSLSVSS